LNRAPDRRQLQVSDHVDRLRRMHCNDLENIPAFWIAGLLLVTTAPPLLPAQLLMYGFVTARGRIFRPMPPGDLTRFGQPVAPSDRGS